MLARVAENVYWLNRYLERTENTVRLVHVHGNMLMDLPSIDDHDGWMPLIAITGLDEEFAASHQQADEDSVSHFLLADTDNPGSLLNGFKAIRENLRSCRDILPKRFYESTNGLSRFVIREVEQAYSAPAKRQAFLLTVEERLLALAGGLNGSMCHDLGYLMMRIGCYLERADMTSRIVDVQSTRLSALNSNPELLAIEGQRWISVLRSASAHQMYRQHRRVPVNGPDTLAFLLTDKYLPRSYRFCLNHLDECLQELEHNEEPRHALSALQLQLSEADLAQLARDPVALHQFVDELQVGITQVSTAISQAYFLPMQESE